ncbi:unnamed protein product [Adineta ricciae]|uniref:Nuclear receptor domain-containing protein n=1 Tax=Adineta ricciae TaxID=249248 RepID=A0A813R6G3_ADIRI|nr:unnamed protein product [Adineta ricciae]
MDSPIHKEESRLTSLCQVCGSDGALVHYGAVCCVSCKMFFRRNIQYDLNAHRCSFNEKCDININSRRACRYCRLQKCIAVNMQRELIRASHCRRHQSQNKCLLVKPIESSANNRSLLSDDQWTRISNVINAYDTKSPVENIRRLLSTQLQQPAKIRLKKDKSIFIDILVSLYRSMLPFVESLPEYQNLNVNDRYELMDRNLSCVGAYNGIPIFRNAGVTLSSAFTCGFPSVYGSSLAEDSIRIAQRVEHDMTIIKLFIPVLLFSTTHDVNYSKSRSKTDPSSIGNSNSVFFNSTHLFCIQNMYVEILFKYLIYRFGYEMASLRFATLLKNFLDQSMCISRSGEVQEHKQLMQSLVKQTETTLTLDDDFMD